MPPKKSDALSITPTLPDVVPCYLMDKGDWGLFKKSIITCGLIWNLPEWRSTIVYQGVDYIEMKKKNLVLTIFSQYLQ